MEIINREKINQKKIREKSGEKSAKFLNIQKKKIEKIWRKIGEKSGEIRLKLFENRGKSGKTSENKKKKIQKI